MTPGQIKEYKELCKKCRVMQMYYTLLEEYKDVKDTVTYVTKDNNVKLGIKYVADVKTSRETLLSNNYRLMLKYIVSRWAKDTMKMRYWETYTVEQKWKYGQDIPWRYTIRDAHRNIIVLNIPEITEEIAEHILKYLHWFCLLKEQQKQTHVTGKIYKMRHSSSIDPAVRRQMEYEEDILRKKLGWEY